ncbi:MAG TPA: aminotransferase class I/II-fold pyridoxal phosphate-dependent enzyme [Candidatus Eremiobacteraceae bacterium]|nr:aminotransferase class I/II-fold pyridoxal phosphate-dependent enzyme [Candidatus Eremiobacteraceae bacterium]
MRLKPFLLEQWIEKYTEPPIEFNLSGSTGPVWNLRDLLQLAGAGSVERLLDSNVVYSRSTGASSLRDALAEMQGVAPEHVLVTIGAAEALAHTFYLAAEPGANVVVPFPCFPPHQWLPESFGLEVRSYHIPRENAFQIDLDEVKSLVDARTKLILVNSPHNPTGMVLSDGDLGSLHDFAAERRIQLVSDEVYHPIYHGRATSSAARLPGATVIGDFSKAFALSGLRLGWIIERDAQRREAYLTTREYVTISNSPVVEFLAEIAVRHRDAILKRTREVATTNLQLLDQVMAAHPDVLQWIRPQGAMIAFPWLVAGGDTRGFCEAAIMQGLLFAPGDCFGSPEHVRIGFGVGQDWYSRAMQRLSDYLRSWARKAPSRITFVT